MPWQKGQSGNPGGRDKRKPISDMYRMIFADEKRLKRFCMAQYRAACKGDGAAARDITDRLEGKAPQALTSPDGSIPTFRVLIEHIGTAHSSTAETK